MICVRLMGGLGNQMFQYAFGRALSLKYNTELVLDQSLLLDKSGSHEINTHRNFDLDIFRDLKFRWATEQEIFSFNGNANASLSKKTLRKIQLLLNPKKLIVQKNNNVSNEYFSINGDTCFVGRFQSIKFFKEQETVIAKDFELKSPEIKGIKEIEQDIKSSISICLHVRRADLLSSPLYSKTIGALDINYYNTAVSIINNTVSNPKYFVFSEDIEWCKQNIRTDKTTVFVDTNFSGTKAEGHFYLMKLCKHFIISNSTFAWWPAYLSEATNKKIIYPKNWYKDANLNNPEMCPPEWIAN